MNLREREENIELEILSEFAKKSKNTSGRKIKEEKCSMRTDFQRDRDRIIHSKAFRRLTHKTQVFISPEGDHYRTRLTHTLEVSQIARTISRGLGLNEDLTEAIALGHDLGHTPFGHAGEYVLNKIYKDGFKHNEQSIRVVEVLEKGGRGLNLTHEVKDGILNHRNGMKPETLEGEVVNLADKIAYINHDIDDALRAKIIKQSDLPKECLKILGETSSKRINFLITDIVEESENNGFVKLSDDVKEAKNLLRDFMFKKVYTNQIQINESKKVETVLTHIYNHFLVNNKKLPKEFKRLIYKGESVERAVFDYIAGMTDRFALTTFNKIFVPSSWDFY